MGHFLLGRMAFCIKYWLTKLSFKGKVALNKYFKNPNKWLNTFYTLQNKNYEQDYILIVYRLKNRKSLYKPAKGSLSNSPSCWLGLGVGRFLGGAGLGGGCFFCFGGRAGTGDFGPIDGLEGDFGANGSPPNKLSGFWN